MMFLDPLFSLPAWLQLLIAAGLVLLGAAFVFLEVFIVSAGLLGLLATACVIVALMLAFAHGPLWGLGFALATPLILLVVVLRGLTALRSSPWVPKAQVLGQGDYSSQATGDTIRIGDEGLLLTTARPTGKARFGDHEIEVQIESGAGERGQGIRILAIDGMRILVSVCPVNDPTSPS